MKRPHYDLTWHGIRRRWASPTEQVNTINGSIGNHYYKSPSAPLLLNNNFELLSSNVINVDRKSFVSVDDRDKQRSESVLDLLGPSISPIRPSNITHSFDMEMIRSELRIIISHLAILTRQVQQQEEDSDLSEEWKFVAMVIDRLCLFLFTASMILFTLLTLFSTPMFSKFK